MRRERKPARWTKRLQWRIEWLVYVVAEGALSVFPVSVVFRIGEMLGSLAWHLFPKRRRIVLRNLRIAFGGEMTQGEIAHLARENFRRTGANLLCSARTSRMTRHQFREVLRVEGLESVSRITSGEGGVIILTPHMGNWEALSRLHLAMPDGVSLAAYYRPLNNPLMDARVLKRREADGTRMFSKADSPLKSATVLKNPICLGILADVRTGFAGEETVFFGRFTRASQLPALIARRAKAPIVALSMRTEAPGKWVVSFHPVEPPPGVENCMAAMEHAMRRSPTDVFWMQDRWKLYLKPAEGLARWFKNVPTTATKKHRGLIWAVEENPVVFPPSEWFHENMEWDLFVSQGARCETDPPLGVRLRFSESVSPDPLTVISSIDEEKSLPLDLILTHRSHPLVRSAARSLGISCMAWE